MNHETAAKADSDPGQPPRPRWPRSATPSTVTQVSHPVHGDPGLSPRPQ